MSSEARKGHRALHRIGWVLLGTALSATSFAEVAIAGVSASMADSFAAAPGGSDAKAWPAARAAPDGRITVAVVVSNAGSVATDVLAPYQVFAESRKHDRP